MLYPVRPNEFLWTLPSVTLGTQPALAFGTAVTPGNLSYGSYVQVFSAIPNQAFEVEIIINTVAIAAAARDCLVTIGVDEVGGTTYVDRIVDLLGSCAASYTGGLAGVGGGQQYKFPLRLPANSSIAAKAMVNSANVTDIRVYMVLRGLPSAPEQIMTGNVVTTYGSTPASASGTALTPGTAARGSYVSLGAVGLTGFYTEFGYGVNDSTMTNVGYEVDVAVGDVTNKRNLIQSALVAASNGETLVKPSAGRYALIGTGDTLFARSQCTGTPDALNSVAAYVVS